MTVKTSRWLQVITIATVLGSHASFGQSTAQITGTVTDPSGAVVTTANVAVTRESTGIQSTAKTNQDGVLFRSVATAGSLPCRGASAGI